MIRLKFSPVALPVSALVTVSFILCMVLGFAGAG
jgi:hypothetical protein